MYVCVGTYFITTFNYRPLTTRNMNAMNNRTATDKPNVEGGREQENGHKKGNEMNSNANGTSTHRTESRIHCHTCAGVSYALCSSALYININIIYINVRMRDVRIILLLWAHMDPYCFQSHRYALQIKTNNHIHWHSYTHTHKHTHVLVRGQVHQVQTHKTRTKFTRNVLCVLCNTMPRMGWENQEWNKTKWEKTK